jgi:hypothetical protein
MMQSGPADPSTTEYALTAVAFIVLWCFQSYLSSVISGWHALIPRFRCSSEYLGETVTIRRFPLEICMRFRMDYTNVVQLAGDEDGLHLSVFFPFRIGHPPLLIPWHEIHEQRIDGFWRSYVLLTLGRTERVPMRLSKRLADSIKEARVERESLLRSAPITS